MKKSINLNIKQNNDDNSIAEIYSGNLSTSRYSNFLICKYVKKNIIDQYSFDKLKDMSIYHFNDLIQIEILSSLKEILKKEIKDDTVLVKVLDSMCEMGLGYLNLARSIPSLSGGELQKLKFSLL